MASDLHRRQLLSCLAALPFTLATAACASEMRGELTFADGGAIPQGTIRVFAEPTGDRSDVVLESDGKARALAFSLPHGDAEPRQIVAVLERKDGWLLARGSAAPSDPLSITLYEAAR
ncbi:hypothetical protein ROJ8625_00246 [Roseivivax jejudonensis]|uniref:Uncharacterized protein n=1 Tax=Roseivivax jejudonensis TaxID=1529041 RepID=A0A1X6Y579_9RHOB|nr:hypothetical protein [Roseivivax jejudonensis]SLN11099.1 hypothetical protein ROJ8625_00246 [Roseivivax jejudonensis]